MSFRDGQQPPEGNDPSPFTMMGQMTKIMRDKPDQVLAFLQDAGVPDQVVQSGTTMTPEGTSRSMASSEPSPFITPTRSQAPGMNVTLDRLTSWKERPVPRGGDVPRPVTGQHRADQKRAMSKPVPLVKIGRDDGIVVIIEEGLVKDDPLIKLGPKSIPALRLTASQMKLIGTPMIPADASGYEVQRLVGESIKHVPALQLTSLSWDWYQLEAHTRALAYVGYSSDLNAEKLQTKFKTCQVAYVVVKGAPDLLSPLREEFVKRLRVNLEQIPKDGAEKKSKGKAKAKRQPTSDLDDEEDLSDEVNEVDKKRRVEEGGPCTWCHASFHKDHLSKHEQHCPKYLKWLKYGDPQSEEDRKPAKSFLGLSDDESSHNPHKDFNSPSKDTSPSKKRTKNLASTPKLAKTGRRSPIDLTKDDEDDDEESETSEASFDEATMLAILGRSLTPRQDPAQARLLNGDPAPPYTQARETFTPSREVVDASLLLPPAGGRSTWAAEDTSSILPETTRRSLPRLNGRPRGTGITGSSSRKAVAKADPKLGAATESPVAESSSMGSSRGLGKRISKKPPRFDPSE